MTLGGYFRSKPQCYLQRYPFLRGSWTSLKSAHKKYISQVLGEATVCREPQSQHLQLCGSARQSPQRLRLGICHVPVTLQPVWEPKGHGGGSSSLGSLGPVSPRWDEGRQSRPSLVTAFPGSLYKRVRPSVFLPPAFQGSSLGAKHGPHPRRAHNKIQGEAPVGHRDGDSVSPRDLEHQVLILTK